METGLSFLVYNPWDGTRNLRSHESKSGVSQYWDQQASLYDTHERLRHIAIELLQLADVSRGLKVIDIGSGTGWAALIAARHTKGEGEVTGFDISKAMVQQAQQKAKQLGLRNVNFYVADAETDLEVLHSYADRITCCSAILYLEDVEGALQKFARWLVDGGTLCFNITEESTASHTRVLDDLLRQRFGLHLVDACRTLCDAATVRQKCLQAGFKNVQIYTTTEGILHGGLGPVEYAEKTWEDLINGPHLIPFEEVLSLEDLEKIKPAYFERTVMMGERWATREGISYPRNMLWVKATK